MSRIIDGFSSCDETFKSVIAVPELTSRLNVVWDENLMFRTIVETTTRPMKISTHFTTATDLQEIPQEFVGIQMTEQL